MNTATPAPAKALNQGVAPVTYGVGDRPPRGDYASAASDYTCAQRWEQYTPEQHALYARLHQRQTAQLPGLACDEFIQAVQQLGRADQVPRFDDINERLFPATRWQVVAVPGLIPEEAFFALLAQRKFPVTEWLRKPEEFDYVVEPDVFHDLYGHVPLLFNPVFADYMQAYGAGGVKAHAIGPEALVNLTRLYWYTVEFGLIREHGALRIYGAGILSSKAESIHCLESAAPNRIGFDLERIMRTRYRIDSYQKTYFVIDSYAQLMDATRPDFTPIYARVAAQDAIPAGEVLPADAVFQRGSGEGWLADGDI